MSRYTYIAHTTQASLSWGMFRRFPDTFRLTFCNVIINFTAGSVVLLLLYITLNGCDRTSSFSLATPVMVFSWQSNHNGSGGGAHGGHGGGEETGIKNNAGQGHHCQCTCSVDAGYWAQLTILFVKHNAVLLGRLLPLPVWCIILLYLTIDYEGGEWTGNGCIGLDMVCINST